MSEQNYYSIGEIARMKHVTIKALRHYHETGLLVPSYINPENGYRYYTLNQLIHLDIIKLCRESQISIKDLQDLFSKADMDYLKKYLEEKKEDMFQQKRQLEKTIRTIDQLSESISLSETILSETHFKMEEYPERYFISGPVKNGEVNEVKSYEKLDRNVKELDLQHSFQYGLLYKQTPSSEWEISNALLLISKEEYKAHQNYVHSGIIPAGRFLTASFSMNTEDEVANSLIKYMEDHDIETHLTYMFYLVADLFNQNNYYGQFQVYLGKQVYE